MKKIIFLSILSLLFTYCDIYDNDEITEDIKPFTEHVYVAHAGGAIIEGDRILTYTNSLESILLNYERGFRVFEIDFMLTEDGRLVAVHDWGHARTITNSSGEGRMTHEEWMSTKIYERYTPLDIDDIVNIMVAHKTIYIVIDTEESPDNMIAVFEEIYRAVKDVDIEIMDRIIPQIYWPSMLEQMSTVYNYIYIIYTLYRNVSHANNQIIEFVNEHANIIAVCMWNSRATEEFVRGLSEIGKPVYVHTVNSLKEALELRGRGVHGFYTDYLFEDLDIQ